MIIALVVAAATILCPSPHRSQTVVDTFRKTHPCPKVLEGKSCTTYVRAGSRFVVDKICGACVEDHICPLACGGVDAVDNLQWLRAQTNLVKGADCSACKEVFTSCNVRR